MTQDQYWMTSISFSALAILVSLIALLHNRKSTKESSINKLLESKTEVLVLASALREEYAELTYIAAQKIFLIQENEFLKSTKYKEHIRLRTNLKVAHQQQAFLKENMQPLRETSPTELEYWESMKATYQSWVVNVQKTIKIEQDALDQLKSQVTKNR